MAKTKTTQKKPGLSKGKTTANKKTGLSAGKTTPPPPLEGMDGLGHLAKDATHEKNILEF